jgi:hypothetical protein
MERAMRQLLEELFGQLGPDAIPAPAAPGNGNGNGSLGA